MKHRTWIITLSLLAILAVSACAAQPTVAPQPTQANTQEVETVEPAEVETEAPEVETEVEVETETQAAVTTEPATQATPMTEEQMLAFLAEKLKGSPHTGEFILSQQKNAEEWSTTLDRMIGKGAKINAEEKQLLITWLINR